MNCCASKNFLLPIFLVLGVGALAAFATPQDGGPARADSKRGAEAQSLEGSMEAMKAAMKRLGREINAKDANAWKTVAGMQAAIHAAKDQEPPSVKAKPEAERAAFLNGYRTMMSQTLAVTCTLEQEILAGKWEEANKTFTEGLRPMEKKGHNEYKND